MIVQRGNLEVGLRQPLDEPSVADFRNIVIQEFIRKFAPLAATLSQSPIL